MSSMNVKDELHARFKPKYEFIPPVRVRGFKRENLAQLFGELGLKRGSEVGVAEGIYSKVLCESIPGLELTCCDLWAPYSTGTRLLKDQAMQNEALALAHEKLDKYGSKFIKAPSFEGAKQVQDGSLDFVFISTITMSSITSCCP